jgi:hypothetical protein
LLEAMRASFGGADLVCSIDDVVDPRRVLQLGAPPTRIDLLSSVTGLESFESAWSSRVDARVFGPRRSGGAAQGPRSTAPMTPPSPIRTSLA